MNHHDPTQTQPIEWRQRFDAFIKGRMTTAFQWGVHDCCLFAADAVVSITGRDLASDVRGMYSDAAGAMRVLAGIGGIEAAGVRVGRERPLLAARVGDIGLVRSGERDMLAVCIGELWLVPAAAGLAALPLDAAVKAWSTTDA